MLEALDAKGVVILAFSEDGFAFSSWGKSKRECKALAQFVDHVANLIRDRVLSPWKDL
jgi:hypothetical protein